MRQHMFYTTPDFQHPFMGVPVVFSWDSQTEILTLQLCEVLIDQWNMENECPDKVRDTEQRCKQFGERCCGSFREANRIIRSAFPEAWKDGACFQEDEDDD